MRQKRRNDYTHLSRAMHVVRRMVGGRRTYTHMVVKKVEELLNER